MALKVIEEDSTMSADGSRGNVVLESDIKDFPTAIGELTEGMEARNLALKWARTKGCAGPCINGNLSGAYPVNKKGEGIDKAGADLKIHAYRVDVPVAGAMG